MGSRGTGRKPSQTNFQTPLPPLQLPTPQSAFRPLPSPAPEAPAGPTFSIRPAFSAELSSSFCSLSLSLCSLAFSLSTASIWASWALPEVAKEAWVLAGPSTPGGLRDPSGPWPRAAGCGGGRCSWGCCRYWYCCCWRNTGGTWACRILGNRRDDAQRLHRAPQSSPGSGQPPWAYWKDKSTQPPTVGKAFSTKCLPKTLKGQENRARGDSGLQACFSPSFTVARA